MLHCNCTATFTKLGRLFMQISYESYVLEVLSNELHCTSDCVICRIKREIQMLQNVLNVKGHFHYHCKLVCCKIISTREELMKVIGVIAKQRCVQQEKVVQ